MKKRKYELKRRAERQAETRMRIVEAAVDLHTSIGPAATTWSAIADRAGVQRHTVYAHFPDTPSLFRACSTHWEKEHPFPDAERWRGITDAVERLRVALTDVYAWYAAVEPDLVLFARDEWGIPELAQEHRDQMSSFAEGLAAGFPRRRAIRAAIGHAIEFETWRSLVRRQRRTQRQAVDAMIRLVTSV